MEELYLIPLQKETEKTNGKLTLMTSEDNASVCEPRNRNGRILVASMDNEAKSVTDDDDAGVCSEA